MSGLSYEEYNTWRVDISQKLLHNSTRYDCDVRLQLVNPVDYFNFEEQYHKTEREVMKFDLRHVKSSDLIIVNFNKAVSQGTTAELAVAYDHDIPILGLNEKDVELHPWDIEFCDRIFTSMDKLVDYVTNFYMI